MTALYLFSKSSILDNEMVQTKKQNKTKTKKTLTVVSVALTSHIYLCIFNLGASIVTIALWAVRLHTAPLHSVNPEFEFRLEDLSRSCPPLSVPLCFLSLPSKHVNVGPTWVSHGQQGYRVGMGSIWASYLGHTWVTQLGPTWVNPGGHLIWGPLG